MFPIVTFDRTREEHLSDVATLVSSPNTYVYVDTNVLAYCFKIHAVARRELLNWFMTLASGGRLCVPAWVANEYISKFKSNKLSDYTGRGGGQGEISRLENLLKDARALVDDGAVTGFGYSSRDDYLKKFDRTLAELRNLIRVFKGDFDVESIHEEIQDAFSSSLAKTDIGALCSLAASVSDARFHHRMPPGYKDARKEENSLGDLVLWLEILEHSKALAQTTKEVVLISNDQKPDWTYAPSSRMHADRAGARIAIPNRAPEIRFVDPRLASEYSAIAQRRFSMLDTSTLVEALSKTKPAEFQSIARAVQIAETQQALAAASQAETTEAVGVAGGSVTVQGASAAPADKKSEPGAEMPTAAVVSGTEGSSTQATRSSARPLELKIKTNGTRDKLYELNKDWKIDSIIADLRSHNWYTQNPAIKRIPDLRGRYPWESWFVLGRNIYQAAHGNASEARIYLENLDWHLSEFATNPANGILAGIAYEIYFDSKGNFRRERKVILVQAIFAELVKARYARALGFIQKVLEVHRKELIYVPGDTAKLPLSIVAVLKLPAYEVSEVKFGDKELLVKEKLADLLEEFGKWSPSKFSVPELVQKVGDRFVVFRDVITVTVKPPEAVAKVLRVPRGLHLIV